MINLRTRHAEVSIERLSQRIAKGQSSQDLLEELVMVIGAVPEEWDELARIDRIATISSLRKTLPLLLEHGAKIATVERGCAFERIFGDPVMLPPPKLIDRMLDTTGEIPLHIFARDRPGDLHEIIPKGAPHRPAHMQKRDIHGRTASHYLWAQDGELVRVANQLRQAPTEDKQARESLQELHSDTMQAVWLAQDMMQALGVEMTIPDKQGITALDLCNDRIEAGDAFILPCESSRILKAFQSRKDLSASTPKSGEGLQLGPRF